MNISHLLRWLLSSLSFGVVEGEGGGAVDEAEDAPEADEQFPDDKPRDAPAEPADDAAEGELVVTIGEDQPDPEAEEIQRAPAWVKELRKQNREMARTLRQREDELKALKSPAASTLGEKPTLAGCDYDDAKFEAELVAWHERKRVADEQAKSAEEAQRKAQENWAKKLEAFEKSKAELKVPDYADAEAVIEERFSVVQRGIIVQGAKNPALLSYALGRNPKKAAELAAITDPVQFAWEAAQLEAQLKVQPRKAAPLPESRLSGSGPLAGTAGDELDKLQKEADRTGDRSKVAAYLRRQRQAQAA